jgi:hypothetical protein
MKRKLKDLPILKNEIEIAYIFDDVSNQICEIYFYDNKIKLTFDKSEVDGIQIFTDKLDVLVNIKAYEEVEIDEDGALVIRTLNNELKHVFFFYPVVENIDLTR